MQLLQCLFSLWVAGPFQVVGPIVKRVPALVPDIGEVCGFGTQVAATNSWTKNKVETPLFSSASSSPTILLLILMVRFLTGRFLSISNSNMPTIVLKLLLRNPILALFQFPVKIHPVVLVKLHLQVFLRYLHIVDEFVLLAGWCPKESGQ